MAAVAALALEHPRVPGVTQTGPISASASTSSSAQDDATVEFVAMYQAHYPRLVRSLEISGASRVDAEDVAQEAFARTLNHWRRVRGGTNPPGYAYRIAFRLVRRRVPLVTTMLDDDIPVPDVAGEAVAKVTVSVALAAMPPRRRICAVLCLLGGLTPAEAGEVLGIEASTVRKQLEHVRGELAVQLER